MGYFKRVAIIKSQQKFEPIDPGYTTDITELCHLASFIEKDVDRVVIPVCPYDKNAFKNFRKSIQRENFDMVAISAMTPGYKSAREYARIAKEAGIYVVMGGYHPTALPEEVLSDPNVDAVIRGEGELPFRDLVLNGPGPDVLGLSYQDNGDQVHNGPQSLIRDLDLLPMPNRKLRPVRFGEKGDAYSVDTVFSSRGCIAKCTFCANDTMNQNFRPRSPEHFVEELEQIHDSKVKKIVKFYDSIFLFDPARVEKIMELMFKRNLTNFRIYTESRSDDMIRCKHLMKDLKRLGFEKILIGIESPDEETFKKLRKGGSVGKHEKAIRILQEADIRMDAFLIIGHTHETEQDIKKYPEFAKRVGLHHQAVYFVMTPYPGTQIYKEYESKNLIESFDWDNYNNFGAVVRLENLDRADLRNLLSYCHGTTAGFSHWVQRQSGIPGIIFRLFYMTIFWLYFFDCQGEDTRKGRNDFIRSFYKACYGSYQKKRKTGLLGKLYQLFSKTFKMRFDIAGEEDSFVMIFNLNRDSLRLDVRPYEKGDGKMLTVTLDDLDEAHQNLDMSSANGLMFLCEDESGSLKRLFRCLSCFPLLVLTLKTAFTVFLNMGLRYLRPSR